MHFRNCVVLAVLLGALFLAASCDDGDPAGPTADIAAEHEEDCGCPE